MPFSFPNANINTFDGLANGIIAQNADFLKVNEVQMTNIIRGDYGDVFDDDPAFSGYGIHAVNVGAVTLEGRLTDPANPAGEPEMDNVVDGVFAESVNTINIKNCRMTNVEYGVNVEINPNAEIKIIGNSISSSTIGVNVNNCPAIDLEISSNVFFSGDATSSEYNTSAITIESVLGSTSSIRDNEITLNTVSDNVLHSGIYINDSENIEAVENNITMVNPTQASYTKSYGFRIDDGGGHLFSCNQIGGSDRDLKRWGFKVDQSPNSKYACNHFQDTRSGMEFSGDCSLSELTTNEFNRHKIALELATADTKIGSQSNGGNTWSGEEEIGARFVANNFSQLNNSRFEITTSNTNNCPQINNNLWPCDIEVGGLSPTDWFSFGPGSTAPTCNFQTECGITPLGINPNNPCNPVSIEIINNQINSVEYPLGIPWLADRGLYTSLEVLNVLPSACTEAYVTYQEEVKPTNLGKLVQIERQTKGSYEIDNFTTNQLVQLRDNIQLFKGKIVEYDDLILQSTNPVDSLALEEDRLGFVKKLGGATATYKTLTNEFNNYRMASHFNLGQLNQQVSIGFDYEENEKSINAIYLETVFIGSRSLTSVQEQTLKTIAALCPMEGGPDAVFQARALASLFRLPFTPVGCSTNSAGQEKSEDIAKEISSTYFSVSPNPTNSMIRADYQFTESRERNWALSDVTGRIIYNQLTNDDGGNLIISLDKLNRGLYFLVIRENGKVIQSEKIIKQ